MADKEIAGASLLLGNPLQCTNRATHHRYGGLRGKIPQEMEVSIWFIVINDG